MVTNEEQSSAGSGDNSLILKFKRNSVSQVTQRGRKSSKSASGDAGSPMTRNSDSGAGASVGEFSLSFGERGASSPSQSNDETASVKSGKSKKSSSREPSRTSTPSATPSATPTVITETVMEQNLPPMSDNSENTDNTSENVKGDSTEATSSGGVNTTPGKTYESSFQEFMARYESKKDTANGEKSKPKPSEVSDHEEDMDTSLVNGRKEKEILDVEKVEKEKTTDVKPEPVEIEKIDKIEKHERKKHRSARRSKEGKAGKVGRPRSSLRSSRDRTGDDLPVKRARQSSGSMPNSPTGLGLLNSSSFPGTMVASGGATYGFATQGGQGPSISPGGLSALFHAAGGDAGRPSNKMTGKLISYSSYH